MIEPWQVWLAYLGDEIRPVVVVSSEFHLRTTVGRMVMVAPLTGQDKQLPFHIQVKNEQGVDSWVMTDQIRSVRTLQFEGSKPVWTLSRAEISLLIPALQHMVDF